MKKTKIIIPALGMLLLSTAASVTGTVAWFSMNSFVNATEMRVQAKAENGIVISNSSAENANWADTATALHNTALALFPTSTLDSTTWCHSNSNKQDSHNTGNPYRMISPVVDATTGAGYLNTNGQEGYQKDKAGNVEADEAYYLLNSFYIKSSADQITKTLYVNSVTVTGNSSSPDLDKALRVLVALHGSEETTAKVFSPVTGGATSYQSCVAVTEDNPETTETNEYAATKEAVTSVAAGTKNTAFLADQVIPARSASPLQIDIYLYFEGEDPACKSTNLTGTLDTLQVAVQFGTATIA